CRDQSRGWYSGIFAKVRRPDQDSTDDVTSLLIESLTLPVLTSPHSSAQSSERPRGALCSQHTVSTSVCEEIRTKSSSLSRGCENRCGIELKYFFIPKGECFEEPHF